MGNANKSLQRARSRAAELSGVRDSVARNRGADFVERVVPSHYVRRNNAFDLTPRRPQVSAAIVRPAPSLMARSFRLRLGG